MSKTQRSPSLRSLPSVEKIVSQPAFETLSRQFGRALVLTETRAFLAELRRNPPEGGFDQEIAEMEAAIRARLERAVRPSLVRVVNATGVLVHTNLGRSPLSESAIAAVAAIARGYSNLELDLRTGKRGSRHRHAEHLFSALFPERSCLVVNNAAAALMLALNTFALGKEVVISRGELVEIGGSFRVPEILERSGARLREVGTTNKTRLADYAAVIGPSTGAILRVHPSNFRVVGFTESAPTEELVRLGRERGLPVIEDFGSGNLMALAPFGLPKEPAASASLAAGIDLCIFSGDKLLGGPQAGILIGHSARIEACRRNPMSRALRVDKLTYAALEATLDAHVRGKAAEEIPVLRMLAATPEEVRRRAHDLVERLGRLESLALDVEPSASFVGGGAAPDSEIPSFVIALKARGRSAERLLEALRGNDPPILARITEDRVVLDLRTILP
ncbi:MAG TPA: L-seryl-tRNA(Sec) selenium transferase, partial [Vicinamibacteria bacterium]